MGEKRDGNRLSNIWTAISGNGWLWQVALGLSLTFLVLGVAIGLTWLAYRSSSTDTGGLNARAASIKRRPPTRVNPTAAPVGAPLHSSRARPTAQPTRRSTAKLSTPVTSEARPTSTSRKVVARADTPTPTPSPTVVPADTATKVAMPARATPRAPTKTPLPKPTRTPTPTPTRTPVPAPTQTPAPSFRSEGAGETRAGWEKRHGQATSGVAGFYYYENGRYIVAFLGGKVQHIERLWDSGTSVSLTEARTTSKRLLPADTRFVNSYTPRQNRLVDLCTSRSLARRFTSTAGGANPWIDSARGGCTVVYRIYNGRVRSVVVDVGNIP